MNAGCNQEERKVRSILYTITHCVTIQCPRVRTDSQLLFSPSKQHVNATLCTRGNLVTSVCGWWVNSSEKTVDAALLFAVAVTSYMYIVWPLLSPPGMLYCASDPMVVCTMYVMRMEVSGADECHVTLWFQWTGMIKIHPAAPCTSVHVSYSSD